MKNSLSLAICGILLFACADENPSAAEPQSEQSEFWARTAKIRTIGDDQEVVQDSMANPLYVINFRTADTLDAYYRDTLSNCVFLADYEYWRYGDTLEVVYQPYSNEEPYDENVYILRMDGDSLVLTEAYSLIMPGSGLPIIREIVYVRLPDGLPGTWPEDKCEE